MAATFAAMVPMVYLSGLIFPIENMPPAIQLVTYLIPLRYYAEIIRASSSAAPASVSSGPRRWCCSAGHRDHGRRLAAVQEAAGLESRIVREGPRAIRGNDPLLSSVGVVPFPLSVSKPQRHQEAGPARRESSPGLASRPELP